jgi:hypothetical protein
MVPLRRWRSAKGVAKLEPPAQQDRGDRGRPWPIPISSGMEVLAVEFNRNHYFMFGLVVLIIGIQLRMVESYVLNETATKFIAEHSGKAGVTVASKATSYLPSVGPTPHKILSPPQWLGWALMSVGGVLILHSLAMPKPGG